MRYLVSFLLFIFFSCSEPSHYRAIVVNKLDVADFSSGSGMESYQGYLYAVGDDSPYLVALNNDGKVSQKWQIWTDEYVGDGRIKKKQKPDFEAVAIDGEQLFIFGSGSKSPLRDVILYGNINQPDSLKTVYVEAFFDLIRKTAKLSKRGLNIEGATFYKDDLILLNRSRNELFKIPKAAFFEYLISGDVSDISIARYKFRLPKISEQPSTFSGAAIIPNTDQLLFTASVEATDNWVNDGEILGSFVGIINMDKLDEQHPLCVPVTDESGNNFIGKIEAASVIHVNKGNYTLVAITDDDDGTTSFLTIQLKKE